ncbi:Fatty-acid-CoA ligase FadD35_1 [Boothiomyces sp. JEL0866]|nr:Fatty-acid-CoA ligase FadD35_1 [Boothiomyces sp. JEL0866]
MPGGEVKERNKAFAVLTPMIKGFRRLTTKSLAVGDTSIPLLRQTIGDNLRQTALHYPNNDALVVMQQKYRATYKEFWDQVGVAAQSLLAIGVKKGDRVGIWAPNRFEWMVIQYATARVGAIMVAINPGYKAHELSYALQLSQTSVLFHSKSFKDLNYVDILSSIRHEVSDLKQSIVMDYDWKDFIAESKKSSIDEVNAVESTLTEFDPINIQFTSGTTGNPKGAMLSHRNILNNGYFTGKTLKLTDKDRICTPVPFYHCFGMVLSNLACTTHGATVVVPNDVFNPKASLEAIQAEKCTGLYGVPTMMIATLDEPDFDKYDLSSLRTGLMAGSTCPIQLMKEVVGKMHMKEVSIGYGMTETSPLSTQTKLTDSLEKRVSTVGQVHPHVQIKVIDPDTNEIVDRGVAGELCTKGYSVMHSYYRNPEATEKSITDGWMHTGDLAVMDEEGYVNIVGRIKDLIIRGGENIYPREIEELLHTHPKVSEAQVIGLPSEYYGEELCVWVKAKPGENPTEAELKEFCHENTADFKVPRIWKFVDGFPLTVTGKVQKFIMRKESAEEFHHLLRQRKH